MIPTRCFVFVLIFPSVVWAQYPYSHGNPTAEEQLALEYIQRARVDPSAEGRRLVDAGTNGHPNSQANIVSAVQFFSVNLPRVIEDFDAIEPAPPLAFNPLLINAARGHSADMRDNNFQSHSGSDNSTSGQRVTAAGYTWQVIGENVFAFVDDVWHSHAGFNIDWGGPADDDGVQDPPGHRNTIQGVNVPGGLIHREIGIGYLADDTADPNDNNPQADGPFLVTHVFASQLSGAGPFVTGVAYEDTDGDNFYTIGEAFPGGLVMFYDDADEMVTAATSSDSGGYAFPYSGSGNLRIRFQDPEEGEFVEAEAPIDGTHNVKVDLQLDNNDPFEANAIIMVNFVKWWRESDWYGFIFGEHRNGWIFSLQHAWQFSVPLEGDVEGVWLFDNTLQTYIWTRGDIYPFYWSPVGTRWLRLEGETVAPDRTWLDFSNNTVKTDAELASELGSL